MDQTMEDMRSMGFEGIFSQSFKTIFTRKNIFAQITLALILPLVLIFIAHMEISNRFFTEIETSPYQLFIGAFNNNKSNNTTKVTDHEWHIYFLFKIIMITIVTILSVLSTTTIIYTIACIYTGRDVTFSESMQVVISVWKRLTITLLFIFLIIFTYTIFASVAIMLCNDILDNHKFRFVSILVTFLVIYALYMFGFMFYTIIFHLAIAVSILEASYGINAIFKAIYLMRGKRKTSLMISFVLYECLAFVVYVMYMHLSMYNDFELALVWRVVIAIMCGVLVVMIFLVIMVTQTVLYLVCKSHHHEAIEVIQFGQPQNQPVFQV